MGTSATKYSNENDQTPGHRTPWFLASIWWSIPLFPCSNLFLAPRCHRQTRPCLLGIGWSANQGYYQYRSLQLQVISRVKLSLSKVLDQKPDCQSAVRLSVDCGDFSLGSGSLGVCQSVCTKPVKGVTHKGFNNFWTHKKIWNFVVKGVTHKGWWICQSPRIGPTSKGGKVRDENF